MFLNNYVKLPQFLWSLIQFNQKLNIIQFHCIHQISYIFKTSHQFSITLLISKKFIRLIFIFSAVRWDVGGSLNWRSQPSTKLELCIQLSYPEALNFIQKQNSISLYILFIEKNMFIKNLSNILKISSILHQNVIEIKSTFYQN